MLSDKDYKKYLYQMLDIEKEMADIYKQCVEKISDEEMKNIFNGLVKEELNHCILVEDAIRMIIH